MTSADGAKERELYHVILATSLNLCGSMSSSLDKYFNTQAMVNPKTPEEVKLVLEEVVAIQQSILERFLEIKRKLDETSKGNEDE